MPNKIVNYLKYLIQKLTFTLTFKKFPGEMKSNYKSWISYSHLKSKYKKYLKNYNKIENKTHEYSNKIWWCWLQGEENAPELCKAGLASIRKNLSEKEVIVITEENFQQYAEFPEYILKKFKEGKITRTHFSDLLRLQLLIKHGGTWIDSTCYLTGKPDYLFETPLFAYSNKERGDDSIVASSWLMSSEKNNPILMLTRDMLFNWWKKHNFLMHYFMLHFFFTMAAEFYKDEWKKIPFYSNINCHVLQRELFNQFDEQRFSQIKKISDVHKLTYKFNCKNLSETFYEKILKGNI